MKRLARWLSGFAPLWLEAILLSFQGLHELNQASESQRS